MPRQISRGKSDAPASDAPDEYDNTIVNQILLRGFLPEGELSEYQKFIWEKINYITTSDSLPGPWQDDYARIKQFLCSLTQEQTDSFFAKRDLHYREVASLDTNGCLRYVGRNEDNTAGESALHGLDQHLEVLLPPPSSAPMPASLIRI